MEIHSLIDKIATTSLPVTDNGAIDSRRAFRELFEELARHTQNVTDAISARAVAGRKTTKDVRIVTALVPREKLPPNAVFCGLTGMPTGGNLPQHLIFMDADYDKMRDIVGDTDTEKSYEGSYTIEGASHTFKYTLKFFDGYLEAQDILYRVDEIVPLRNAVIHMPYMRKAFYPEAVDSLPEKAVIDWKYQENAIPAIEDAALAWNLHIQHPKIVSAQQTISYGDTKRYVYHHDFGRDSRHFVAVPDDATSMVYKHDLSEKGTDIETDQDLQSFFLCGYNEIDLAATEIKQLRQDGRLFDNKLWVSPFPSRSIISKSDIAHAVYALHELRGLACELLSHCPDTPACLRYSRKYRESSAGVRTAKRVTAHLKFSETKKPTFYLDSINFALLYLERYYPEVNWIGYA